MIRVAALLLVPCLALNNVEGLSTTLNARAATTIHLPSLFNQQSLSLQAAYAGSENRATIEASKPIVNRQLGPRKAVTAQVNPSHGISPMRHLNQRSISPFRRERRKSETPSSNPIRPPGETLKPKQVVVIKTREKGTIVAEEGIIMEAGAEFLTINIVYDGGREVPKKFVRSIAARTLELSNKTAAQLRSEKGVRKGKKAPNQFRPRGRSMSGEGLGRLSAESMADVEMIYRQTVLVPGLKTSGRLTDEEIARLADTLVLARADTLHWASSFFEYGDIECLMGGRRLPEGHLQAIASKVADERDLYVRQVLLKQLGTPTWQALLLDHLIPYERFAGLRAAGFSTDQATDVLNLGPGRYEMETARIDAEKEIYEGLRPGFNADRARYLVERWSKPYLVWKQLQSLIERILDDTHVGLGAAVRFAVLSRKPYTHYRAIVAAAEKPALQNALDMNAQAARRYLVQTRYGDLFRKVRHATSEKKAAALLKGLEPYQKKYFSSERPDLSDMGLPPAPPPLRFMHTAWVIKPMRYDQLKFDPEFEGLWLAMDDESRQQRSNSRARKDRLRNYFYEGLDDMEYRSRGKEAEKIVQEIIAKNTAPILLQVATNLPVNSAMTVDSQGRRIIILERNFALAILAGKEDIVQWLLAERVFHEMDHSLEFDSEFEEEGDCIYRQFVIYRDCVAANNAFFEEIKEYFAPPGLKFHSGNYFGYNGGMGTLLLLWQTGKTEPELRGFIAEQLRSRYANRRFYILSGTMPLKYMPSGGPARPGGKGGGWQRTSLMLPKVLVVDVRRLLFTQENSFQWLINHLLTDWLLTDVESLTANKSSALEVADKFISVKKSAIYTRIRVALLKEVKKHLDSLNLSRQRRARVNHLVIGLLKAWVDRMGHTQTNPGTSMSELDSATLERDLDNLLLEALGRLQIEIGHVIELITRRSLLASQQMPDRTDVAA